jgi:catechol 2,3-dioxygenase-like lactoylglutathione lyase family enzyme
MADVLRVTGLDHVVLDVADPEASIAFYCGELGLAPERVEEWRRHEAPFPSVRVDATTVIDLLGRAPTGANVDHVCLVLEPTDLDALAMSGRFEVISGPVPRWGAQGVGSSLYIRDPDGNTVELRHYGDVGG